MYPDTVKDPYIFTFFTKKRGLFKWQDISGSWVLVELDKDDLTEVKEESRIS